MSISPFHKTLKNGTFPTRIMDCWCKLCRAKYNKQYYRNHKEEASKYNAKYHQEHKEEISRYFKEYYHKHKTKINKKNRQWAREYREYANILRKRRREKIKWGK